VLFEGTYVDRTGSLGLSPTIKLNKEVREGVAVTCHMTPPEWNVYTTREREG